MTIEDRCPGLVSDDSGSGGEVTVQRTASKAKKPAKKAAAAAAASDGLKKGASVLRLPAGWRLARGRGTRPLCCALAHARRRRAPVSMGNTLPGVM